jgi:hypothetical protein
VSRLRRSVLTSKILVGFLAGGRKGLKRSKARCLKMVVLSMPGRRERVH